MSKPFRISTHEPLDGGTSPNYGCTGGRGLDFCPSVDAYAVRRKGKAWRGDATCREHAGRRLWVALVAADEAGR